jgi:hypothetical protein
MKFLMIFATLTGIAFSVIEGGRWKCGGKLDIFEEWKMKFNKSYPTKSQENEAKFNLLENKKSVDEHNELYRLGKVSYKRGLNRYSDITTEEQEEILTGLAMPPVDEIESVSSRVDENFFSLSPAPKSIDWSRKGLVTSVHDQGSCSSCWAFSAVGVIEGVLRKKNMKLDVSPQHLIDCVTQFCWGCSSGWPKYALDYVKNNGIAIESEYPYKATDSFCSYDNETGLTGIIDDVFMIPTRGKN